MPTPIPNREMVTRLPRAASCVLATLAIATSLGACGSSGGGSSTVAIAGPLASAAYATSQTGGAHMALSGRIEATGLPSPVTISGSGFFNYSSHEGTLSMTLAGLPASAVTGSSTGIEEIFKGTDIYIGSSLFAGKLPAGARWMKLDLARVGAAAGIDPTQLLSGQSNPAQFLEYLKASGGSVQTVGRDTVRGVPTIHYHGTIDAKKAARVFAEHAGKSSLRESFEKEVAKVGLTTIPVDVWIDSHRLVRRMQLSFRIPAGGQTASINMTIELFGFGATPAVSTPPASETFDATSTALGSPGALSG
jgi:hypothetical protein